jgi:hypothetical protein
MKILLSLILTVSLIGPAMGETTLSTRLFSMSDTLTMNGLNLTETFQVPQRFVMKEAWVAWTNPGKIELSYTYGNRRTFEGSGSPEGFIFKGVEFQSLKDKPLALSGSFLSHKVDAKVLSFMPWLAPLIRWQSVNVQMSVSGKPKSGGSEISLSENWSASSFGLGAYVGTQPGPCCLEAYGLVYLQHTGHEIGIRGLYAVRNWLVGGGYQVERNSIGPVRIERQGPFVSVGVRF